MAGCLLRADVVFLDALPIADAELFSHLAKLVRLTAVVFVEIFEIPDMLVLSPPEDGAREHRARLLRHH